MRIPNILAAVLVCATFVSSPGAAQVPFVDAPAVSSAVDGPTCVRAADVDNDGDVDVVASAYWTPEVCWFENNGSASFTKHVIGTELDQVWFVVVGDLDGDGDQDVVAGSRDFNDAIDLSWYENPTVGVGSTWVQHTVLNLTSQGIVSMALGDIDRDGDRDLVLAAEGGGESGLYWLANNGSGTSWGFHLVQILATGQNAFGTAVADVEGDGDLDVIATLSGGNAVAWWENVGGSPPADGWSLHMIDATMAGAAGVAAGDLDGDGDVDVVAAGFYADKLSWYERSGASWTEHAIRSSFAGAWAVELVDMDMDADLDVLATAYDADQVVWFENTAGDGSDWLFRGVEAGFDGARWAVAGDFDGDGDPDVAAAAEHGDTIDRWTNQTIHRTYTVYDQTVVRDEMIGAESVAAGDLNGDGTPDLVAGRYGSDTITVLYGLDPAADLWWEHELTASFAGVDDVAVADLDRDGDLDIIGAATYDDAVAVWSNGGGALPSWSKTTILASFDAKALGVGDFDSDGDDDVVVAGFVNDTVQWLENGNGWLPHVVRSNINGPIDLAVGDVNNDGTVDIVASASVGDRVVAYLNFDGTGTLWWESDIVTAWDSPRGIDIADVNRDGNPDVVAAAYNADEVAWFENSGSGTSWTKTSISTALDGPRDVATGDFDADGDIDLVAIEGEGGRFFWWSNDGGAAGFSFDWGGWTSTYAPRDLAVADIDRDGYPDFVLVVDAPTAGGVDDTVGWIRNLGGQYYAGGWPTNDEEWADGETKEVFAFALSHLGRAGDSSAELTGLRVRFEDAAGLPMTNTEVNDLFDRLEIFRDMNGNHDWDAGDLEIVEISGFTVTGSGEQPVVFVDGDSDVNAPAAGDRQYFVVLTTTDDASSHTPRRFRLTLPEEQIGAEDAAYDIPLRQSLSFRSSRTQIISLSDVIFADDFESGDLWEWSDSVP